MFLPKKLRHAVNFSLWCKRERQAPEAVAKLIVLAESAKRAGERDCNGDGHRQKYETAMRKFEDAAILLGYKTDWPGLWPVLNRDGSDVYLPE